MSEALYDTETAARVLGISARTLGNWRCKDVGPPFVKLRRSVKYDPQALAEWIASCRVVPNAHAEADA